MQQKEKEFSFAGSFVLCALLLNAIVLKEGLVTHSDRYALLALTIPLLAVSIIVFKSKRS